MILITRALGCYLVRLRGNLIFLHVPHMQSLFTGGRGDIIVRWEKGAEFIFLTETATFLLWNSREYILHSAKIVTIPGIQKKKKKELRVWVYLCGALISQAHLML